MSLCITSDCYIILPTIAVMVNFMSHLDWLQVPQVFGQHNSGCLSGCLWRSLAAEWVDGVNALPNVGGPHPIS